MHKNNELYLCTKCDSANKATKNYIKRKHIDRHSLMPIHLLPGFTLTSTFLRSRIFPTQALSKGLRATVGRSSIICLSQYSNLSSLPPETKKSVKGSKMGDEKASLVRCEWSGTTPKYLEYHDKEWGVPEYDDRKLFEMIILEGAQAGLSWLTILKKREGYREAFAGFDPYVLSEWDEEKVEELMMFEGIVRNRLKIRACVKNAKGFKKIVEEFGLFSKFIWGFVDGKPVQNDWKKMGDLPTQTDVSKKLSKELKKFGFSFVGPTTMYAFMQAVGMVNDHSVDCFRYGPCRELGSK